jgi:hypothetical protein
MGTGIARRGPLMIRMMVMMVAALGPVLVYFSPNGMMRSPHKSGNDLLRAAFEEKDLGDHPKALYLNGSDRNKETSVESRDEKKQKQLWTDSLKLARIRDGDTLLKEWQ